MRRTLVYAALLILYLLHNDLWLWNDGRLWRGLPAGMLYHIGYCFAVSLLMAVIVRYAWRPDADSEGR